MRVHITYQTTDGLQKDAFDVDPEALAGLSFEEREAMSEDLARQYLADTLDLRVEDIDHDALDAARAVDEMEVDDRAPGDDDEPLEDV